MEKEINVSDLKGQIKETLRKVTEDYPKDLNPKELPLLVKPNYFDEAIENGPGLSIFKAPYGRGKTYGIGYYTFHEGRKTGKYDTIYINLRDLSRTFSDAGINNINLTNTAIDLPSYICAGAMGINLEQGSYLSSLSSDVLMDVCKDIKSYISKQELGKFFETVAEKTPKRLIIVVDEFENVLRVSKTTTGIAESIIKLMNSLRPGVLDKYPFKINIVLAIQYLYYPSAAIMQYLQSGQPILGKMYSVNSDYTIPVEYSANAYYEYVKLLLNYLKSKGFIDDDKMNRIVEALEIDNKVKKVLEQISSLPARIVFENLRDLVTELSVYNDNNYSDFIVNYVNDLISRNSIYKIYVIHKVPAELSNFVTPALEYLAKQKWGNSIAVDPVNRRGYEGIMISANGLYRIILFKQNEVKYTQSEKFREGFVKVYGNFIAKWCTKSVVKKEDECKVIIMHPESVRVGAIVQELRNLQTVTTSSNQKGGIKVSLSVDEISLDYDELASLIGSVESAGGLGGDKNYFQARVEELKNKLT